MGMKFGFLLCGKNISYKCLKQGIDKIFGLKMDGLLHNEGPLVYTGYLVFLG
jgi:hypothetical protein